jgi:hypothetical protein
VREGAADQPAARRVHSAGVLCGQGLWCGLAACGAGGSQERYSAAGGCLVLGLKGDCGGLCVLPTLCTAVPSGVKASWDGG